MKSKHLLHQRHCFSNVLSVNIWAIFKIFQKMELLIPLYNNIQNNRKQRFLYCIFTDCSKDSVHAQLFFLCFKISYQQTTLKCFVPEPNINIHIGKNVL